MMMRAEIVAAAEIEAGAVLAAGPPGRGMEDLAAQSERPGHLPRRCHAKQPPVLVTGPAIEPIPAAAEDVPAGSGLAEPERDKRAGAAGPEPLARIARRRLHQGKQRRRRTQALVVLREEAQLGAKLGVAVAETEGPAVRPRVGQRGDGMELQRAARAVVDFEARQAPGGLAAQTPMRRREIDLEIAGRRRAGIVGDEESPRMRGKRQADQRAQAGATPREPAVPGHVHDALAAARAL